jgi:hypothetical protein
MMDRSGSLYSHGRAAFPVCRVLDVKPQEAMTYWNGSIDDAEAEFVRHVGALLVTLTAAYPPDLLSVSSIDRLKT